MRIFFTLIITILISITFQAISQNLPTSCEEGSVLIAYSNDNKSIASCITPYIAKKFIAIGWGWIVLDGKEVLENFEDIDEASAGPICTVDNLFIRRKCFLTKFNGELVFVIASIPLGLVPSGKLIRGAVFKLNYRSNGLKESKGTIHYYLPDPNEFFWSDGKTVIVAVGNGPLER